MSRLVARFVIPWFRGTRHRALSGVVEQTHSFSGTGFLLPLSFCGCFQAIGDIDKIHIKSIQYSGNGNDNSDHSQHSLVQVNEIRPLGTVKPIFLFTMIDPMTHWDWIFLLLETISSHYLYLTRAIIRPQLTVDGLSVTALCQCIAPFTRSTEATIEVGIVKRL